MLLSGIAWQVGVVGRIVSGEEIGRYVKVVDDSGKTGGYLILTAADGDLTEDWADAWLASRGHRRILRGVGVDSRVARLTQAVSWVAVLLVTIILAVGSAAAAASDGVPYGDNGSAASLGIRGRRPREPIFSPAHL